jgi:hypothetical protein
MLHISIQSNYGLLFGLGQGNHCVHQLQQCATPHMQVNMSWYGSSGKPLSILNKLYVILQWCLFL